MRPLHGWLILNKPVGLGSTQGVAAVKRVLRTLGFPKAKVGHGGTLDPLASGVLPIAIGEATKLSGRMLDADKAYDFNIRFGAETDTLDAEGQVVETSPKRPSLAEVEAVLPRFTGPIEQVPPIYSALKVDGRRAYDLARAGEAVELATRAVTIHSLQILPPCGGGRSPLAAGKGEGEGLARGAIGARTAKAGIEPAPANPSPRPLPQGEREMMDLDQITLSARVSKGTYIRSLARDIAHALGTVGHVTMLHRIKAGPFRLENAVSMDKLNACATADALQALVLPLTAGLDDIPALPVSPAQAQALRQGRRLDGAAAISGLHLALLGDLPVALVEEGRVVRGFNLMSE